MMHSLRSHGNKEGRSDAMASGGGGEDRDHDEIRAYAETVLSKATWKEEEGGERRKRKIVAGRDMRFTNDQSLSIVGIEHYPWDLREIDTAVERDDSARNCELGELKLNNEGCTPGAFEDSGRLMVSKTSGFHMDDPVTLRAAEENMVWVANPDIEANKQKGESPFRSGEDDSVNPTAEGDHPIWKRYTGILRRRRLGRGPETKLSASTSQHSIISRNFSQELLTERYLPRDTFSFLIYTKRSSLPSLLAALVFCIQTAIFSLVSVDVIDMSNPRNPLNFPPNVESTVRTTEVLAIIIAIITQDDVKKVIHILRDGYDENSFHRAFGCEASRFKWSFSIVLRGLEGLLGLFVTFMLIMQSETVLDLLLNFSAMEFVSLMDDVAFSMLSEGYLGIVMMREAKALSMTKYHISCEKTFWKTSRLTAAYFIMIFAVMITGWGMIYANQASGKYLCERVYIQLDDSLAPNLAMLSGIYTVGQDKGGDRMTSVQVREKGTEEIGGIGILGYCKKDKRWTFTLQESSKPHDPCEDWIAASSESIDFDVTKTVSSRWYARTSSGRVLPISTPYIDCYDCLNKENFCGESSLHGKCESNKCSCDGDRYGLRCEFEQPCSVLEVDPKSMGFVGNRVFASRYNRSSDNELFNRPVYTNTSDAVDDVSDFIWFNGRRWVVTSGDLPSLQHKDHITSISNREASFISDPVQIDSRADMAPYPLELVWHPALAGGGGPDLSRNIDVALICAVCNNQTNKCLYEGVCSSKGSCECAHGASGSLCQIAPTSNGYCDTYFNTPDFEYDGGDCCEISCVSTGEYRCGKASSGFIDIGYPYCNATDDARWFQSGNFVEGVNSAARSGTSVVLGGIGGTVLVVGDLGSSVVRLFDRDGSNWIQRGHVLQGPPSSDFGHALSLSKESENVKMNAYSSPTVTLAVGAPIARLVRVYQCKTNGCEQVGSDIENAGVDMFGSSVSLTGDGAMIAIGAKDHCFPVEVYKNAGGMWVKQGNPINPINVPSCDRRKLATMTGYYHGYYVALSGNGERLVVGSIDTWSSSGMVTEYSDADLIVTTHQWNATIESWEIMEDETLPSPSSPRSLYLYDTPQADWPQKCIALSDDGDVLAVGGSDLGVNMYSWNQTSSAWAPRSIDLNTTQSKSLIGWSLDLSADGSILALGTGVVSQEAASGNAAIQVLKWNGTYYSPYLSQLSGGETSAVSLSRDGRALAVGLPYYGKNGGTTTVYKFQPPGCDGDSKLLRLSFTTDKKPHESNWTIQVGPNIAAQGRPNDDSTFTTFVEELCVPANECIKFRVFDSAGDGMDPPGGYSLMLDGTEVANGGGFGFGEIKHIAGDCDCPAGHSLLSIMAVKESNNEPSMEWALSYQNRTSLSEYVWKGSMSNDIEIFEECIPEGCWHLTNPNPRCGTGHGCKVSIDWFYNITYKGCSKVEKGSCGFCPEDISFGKCLPGQNATVTYPEIPPTEFPTYHPPSTGSPTFEWTFRPTSSPHPTESPTSSHRPTSSPHPTYSPTSSRKPTEQWSSSFNPTLASCWP